MELRTPSGRPVNIKKEDIVTVNKQSIGQEPGSWDEDGEFTIPATIVLGNGTQVEISDDSYKILHSEGF